MKPIPESGFLRLRQVLALIPVAKSTWLAGCKSGRFPQPSKALGEHITVWKYEDIRRLIDQPAADAKGLGGREVRK